MQFVWFVFGADECHSDNSSTCAVYENSRQETGRQSRVCVSRSDRSLSCKGSYVSRKHKAVMHDSGRMREAYAKVSSDVEYLSSIPSETANCEKLSLDAQKVYVELQEISNKLKVPYRNIFIKTGYVKLHAVLLWCAV